MVFAGTDPLTTGQRHILRHATNLAGYPSKTEGHTQTAVKHSRLSMLDCIKFRDYFTENNGNRRSNSHSLFISQSHINAFRYSYFVNATHVWNKLPISVVQSPSLNQDY